MSETANPKKAAKAELEASKTALKEFMRENKLKEDSAPEDKKVAKKFAALKADVDEKRKALKALKAEGGGRKTTYTYPDGMTDPKEKKKFRARARAEKNKSDKPAKEKPAKEAKSEDKPKKKKAAVEAED